MINETDLNEVLYENLDYGAYALIPNDIQSFGENVKYASADFNKLHVRKVRLPDGKGNVIYLLSNSFDNTIRFITTKQFITPPSYRKIYFPYWYVGRFMGRRCKVSISGTEKTDRKKIIGAKTKLRLLDMRVLNKTPENIFFFTSDIYNAIVPILNKFNARKNYTIFFNEFSSILNRLTPDPVKESPNKNDNNRVLIIDAEQFGFKNGAPLNENKTNPLFLFYLLYLKNRDMKDVNVDLDMMVCSKNMFIKFNPSKLTSKDWPVFRRALFKIMNADLDQYTATLNDAEKSELELSNKDKAVTKIVNDTIEPFTKNVSPSTKLTLANAVEKSFNKKVSQILATDKAIKDVQKKVATEINGETEAEKLFKSTLLNDNEQHSFIKTNPVKDPLSQKRERLFNSIGGQKYMPMTTKTGLVMDDDDEYDPDIDDEEEIDMELSEEDKDDIKDDVSEILTDDEEVAEEVMDDIQEKIAPMKDTKKAPVSSPRDQKLREQQKKVMVKESSIEEILDRDYSNVPIESSNKESVMHTSNKNMYNIKFANFNKTYLDQLYTKDLVVAFDSLKDEDRPFYITNIEIKDTSTSMTYKDTWTVHLVDETNKKYTIKVDIPKFVNDRFMWIEGSRWIILNQNFYNPLVKDTPDTVIMTTNYNKVTIRRKSTKSLSTIERIFTLIKKTGDNKIFISGDSSRSNTKYISSLEYDELSRKLFKIKTKTCEIYFSRDYIKENMSDQIPKDKKNDEFFIGFEGKAPILINEDTGLDRVGRTISEIIEQNLPDEYKSMYANIKAPTQLMFVEAKMAGEFIPAIIILVIWEGLKKTLDRMKISWRFDNTARKVPVNTSGKKYIRFADGVLEYDAKTFAELLMNGLSKLHPEKLRFEDFETEECYSEFIYSQWGSYNGINEIRAFYEFLIDPITKKVCKDMLLPDDPSGLLIRAVQLLADNSYVSKSDDRSYRVRTIEIIPSILYSCLAAQYKAYAKSGGRVPFTLNQNCVIKKLRMEKTVEAYSTLNPVIEVYKTHTISTKGYKGSNSEHSYDEEKRTYDPSSIGKLAMSTSPDANVGITKSLTVEPTITNARGYREPVEDNDTLKDVNIFSPVEMLTPGTERGDDPIRTAIAGKQSQHVVPVANAAPALVSNGFDEALQFHLSDDFVINAEEDGQVIDVNDKLGFIMVKYKSGKTKAINTKVDIVKNSGGGFYMSNQLVPVYTKVGQKFKKDQVLAYHPKYFKYSELNGLRYAMGPIAKVAVASSYNTYEDAGICTYKFASQMATSIVYLENGRFKRNNNILDMVKIGDHVNVGDSLIKFDQSVEDDELSKYLTKLSAENAAILEEESKNDIKTSHAGKVIDIKVYSLLDPSNLSPSLAKIVKQYFDKGISKKEYLNKFDSTESTMKAGYLLTDSTEPIKNKYNTIKGNKGIDVLIEIYIEHGDVLGVGDKIAVYGPNKQIVSELIPQGYEPYSEYRPDEEISILAAPGSISRRMITSILPIMATGKIMKELKEKIRKDIKYK